MKLFKILLTILFISLLSSPSWSVSLYDLVERDGIHYEKFTDVPFTGKVTGKQQGSFKKGIKDGAWVGYHNNGQLWNQGNYKNGVKEGAWVYYYENGQLEYKSNFKNGKKEGTWIRYWENGQIHWKGNYKNGKEEGAWVSYNKDGTVFKPWTGTYKDGVMISD